MELILLILAAISFILMGYSSANDFMVLFVITSFCSVIFIAFYTISIIELPITIKSSEKLELIQTIATPTDTIFKYQIINK
jgi:hypothetical protein